MRSLFKASLLVSALFALDKIVSLGVQFLVARAYGVGSALDAYNAANNLPDTLFLLISGGALNLAMIPLLRQALEREGRPGIWRLFSQIANFAFAVTAALALLIFLFAPWLVANLPAAAAFTNLYSRALVADSGNIRGVQETSKGIYFQADAKGTLLGLDYAFNGGIRYVKTDQSSYGLNSGVMATVTRSYDDWLPSANLAIYPARNVILRAAVADVMTRPTLGSLTPGGSADGFNFKVTSGNPFLNPYRATNYDLSAEWYFAPQSVLSAAYFIKKVHTFTQSSSITGATFDQTGLPEGSAIKIGAAGHVGGVRLGGLGAGIRGRALPDQHRLAQLCEVDGERQRTGALALALGATRHHKALRRAFGR